MTMFTSLRQRFEADQQVSLHQCKDTPCSGLPRARCPPSIFHDFFKKYLDYCVETDRTSERFFGRKPDLVRSKGDGLRGVRRCCSFKDPSTYASAATA
jgi:hypothetical protein